MSAAPLWKVDFHMHSRYSHDSSTTLEQLAERARQVGLDRIALTDHNTAQGALLFAADEPELAIAGEEVKTTEGEIIGLFLREPLRTWQKPEFVMDQIHDQGGLVYVPHPFDRWRANFRPDRLVALADRIDIIEAYNQWADPGANAAAEKIAGELGKAMAYGSDAHSPSELGHSWIEVEPFARPADLLANLARARFHKSEVSGTQRRA